jgi:hypothetical protein
MTKLSNTFLKFASGNQAMLDLGTGFAEYWEEYRNGLDRRDYLHKESNQYNAQISFAEKEDRLNKAMLKEIVRLSNVPVDGLPFDQWFTAPTVSWATFAVVNQLIDLILPQTIMDSISLYTDVVVGDFGSSYSFDIKARDLFAVSKGGRAQKVSEITRDFNGQVTLTAENHLITVGASLYRILAGKDSLADLTAKAVRSIETRMTTECYNTLYSAMINLSTTTDSGLQVTGYTQANLVSLGQRVQAWNFGAKPVIVGTQLALVNVLPDDANYRYTLTDDYADRKSVV